MREIIFLLSTLFVSSIFAKSYNGKMNHFKNTSCAQAKETLAIALSSFEGEDVTFDYKCKANGRDALANVVVIPIANKEGLKYQGRPAGFIEDGLQISGESAGQARMMEIATYVPSLVSGGKVRMSLSYSKNNFAEQLLGTSLLKTQHILSPEFILID